MYSITASAVLAVSALLLNLKPTTAAPFSFFPPAISICTPFQQIAAVAQEIKTIGSHSPIDAALIPLASNATRAFYVIPTGGDATLVNAGIDALSVRGELVVLSTLLNAGVPTGATYIINSNGSITSDFTQTDNVVLKSVAVRELHYFDSNCQITSMLGWVHGDVFSS